MKQINRRTIKVPALPRSKILRDFNINNVISTGGGFISTGGSGSWLEAFFEYDSTNKALIVRQTDGSDIAFANEGGDIIAYSDFLGTNPPPSFWDGLPTATDTIKGGIKVGTGLEMVGDTLNATGGGGGNTNISIDHQADHVIVESDTGTDGTINAATTTLAGAMTATDKTNLDNLANSTIVYNSPKISKANSSDNEVRIMYHDQVSSADYLTEVIAVNSAYGSFLLNISLKDAGLTVTVIQSIKSTTDVPEIFADMYYSSLGKTHHIEVKYHSPTTVVDDDVRYTVINSNTSLLGVNRGEIFVNDTDNRGDVVYLSDGITDLGNTTTAVDVTITSSTGADTTLAAATTSQAGVLSAADKENIDEAALTTTTNLFTEEQTFGNTSGPNLVQIEDNNIKITNGGGYEGTITVVPAGSSPNVDLDFNGNIVWHEGNLDPNNISGDLNVDGNINATGEITALSSSDTRLKQNIKELPNGLDVISRLRPVSFNWNKEAVKLNSRKDIDSFNTGLIAQEVEGVTPEIVGSIYNKYKGVDYVKLIPYLIKAVQELSAELSLLQND